MDIPHEFIPVLLVPIVLFLGLWMLLKRLWFDPALKIIAAREARSQGAIEAAKRLRDEAERMRAEHEAAIAQAKAEAQREVQEILRQAEAEQRRLIGDANDDAQRTIARVRGEIANEIATARQALRDDAHAIAREVAGAVLGRTV